MKNALVVIMVIAAVLLSGCGEKSTPGVGSREISALVNGEKIYMDDVNEEYASLTSLQQESITRADALSFIIEREVLYQEAVGQGMDASGKEVDDEYGFFLMANNISDSELKARLAGRNSTVERLKATLRKQIMINKLFDQAIPRQFIIRSSEVEAIYNSSNYGALGITLEQAEKSIVEFITAQRQAAERTAFIERLKDEADVLVVAVPG